MQTLSILMLLLGTSAGGPEGGSPDQPGGSDATAPARDPAADFRRDLGTWDVEIAMMGMADGEPAVTRGTETNTMLGPWLVSRFEGEVMGGRFEGLRQTVYDPSKKAFVGSWIDSTSPYATHSEGRWSEDGKAFTATGTGRNPMGGEMKTRMVTVYHRDGSRVTSMYLVHDGGDFKMMEFRYTRREG